MRFLLSRLDCAMACLTSLFSLDILKRIANNCAGLKFSFKETFIVEFFIVYLYFLNSISKCPLPLTAFVNIRLLLNVIYFDIFVDKDNPFIIEASTHIRNFSVSLLKLYTFYPKSKPFSLLCLLSNPISTVHIESDLSAKLIPVVPCQRLSNPFDCNPLQSEIPDNYCCSHLYVIKSAYSLYALH